MKGSTAVRDRVKTDYCIILVERKIFKAIIPEDVMRHSVAVVNIH